jgi:hypothetical protein
MQMVRHRYKVGQSLSYSAGQMGRREGTRTCKVMRLLPKDESGVPQYRIQCTAEAVERVAKENTLSHG